MNPTSGAHSVTTIDTHYLQPRRAASYLIVEGGRAAFVDNNTPKARPHLLAALEAHGLTPGDVDFAIVTHVHLDHAAGTAALLEACPNAMAVVHPLGARHLANPVRLVKSAMQVYGESAFKALYGVVEPVHPARIRTVEDNEVISWGARRLTFLHTLGHAKHHLCIHDSGSNGVFTGDAFGIAFPGAAKEGRRYLLCSCPPTDFDAEQARVTARRVVATGAETAYLTHYGAFSNLAAGAEILLRSIDAMEAILNDATATGLEEEALRPWCRERVLEAIARQLGENGIDPDDEEWAWLQGDAHMNAIGLAYYATRRRAS